MGGMSGWGSEYIFVLRSALQHSEQFAPSSQLLNMFVISLESVTCEIN